MLSMTGYGEGAAEDREQRVEVQLRAVNHRFLDLALRLPEELRGLEPRLERLLRGRLGRGRIEARVVARRVDAGGVAVRVRIEVIRALRRALAELEDEGLAPDELRPFELLRLPGVLEVEAEAPAEESVTPLLERAVEQALGALLESRRAEGERLAEVLGGLAGELEAVVGRLEGAREGVREALGRALAARLEELVSDPGVPPERIAQEAAILVDKSDVREELDRLRVHLGHFREALGAPGGVGKRLDFLAQEMLRELNTVGAKCRDAAMTRDVVEGKLACEQLREQLQNVE